MHENKNICVSIVEFFYFMVPYTFTTRSDVYTRVAKRGGTESTVGKHRYCLRVYGSMSRHVAVTSWGSWVVSDAPVHTTAVLWRQITVLRSCADVTLLCVGTPSERNIRRHVKTMHVRGDWIHPCKGLYYVWHPATCGIGGLYLVCTPALKT